MRPALYLRSEFVLPADPARARFYVTSLGVYSAAFNRQPASDHVLAPGWTSYDTRLRYQTLDVTHLLAAGRNAIAVSIADGWYRGRIGFPGSNGEGLWGDEIGLLAQLEVTCLDGSTLTVATGLDWRAAPGPVLHSSLYDGESYDARRETPGWSLPGFDDADWQPVTRIERDLSSLVAPQGPPVRRVQVLRPSALLEAPDGTPIIDFGQNFAGRVRFRASGPAGTTVTLRHAEVLEDGALCTRPLRGARATDSCTLRGGGPETWEPEFTYHGFRYAGIEGWPGPVETSAFEGVVCHSDLRRIGWFECSDERVNRLHENVVWSMRSNFFDIPTDCPQRDERLGWTGDIAVFAPTACFLYDVAGFLSSWLGDVAADQDERGVVPLVVPDALGRQRDPSRVPFGGVQAIWGDAAVLVPWTLYQRYGDRGILERQYPGMAAWMGALEDAVGPGRRWERGFQLADWLDPAAPPERPGQAMTDPHLVATAYFAHVSGLMAEIAGLLHRDSDGTRYRQLASEVATAFRAEYVTPNGRLASDTQTAHALALVFGLLDTPAQRQRAGRRLSTLVQRNGYRVGTGFAGTPLILDALCLAGESDAALKMLLTEECPSWLYPLTMGATTVWERWDSLRPDGSVNPGQMTSFNHYALGAVADWLHRRIGGLAPLEPGYRRFLVDPLIGGPITSASVRHDTPYGLASVEWRAEGDGAAVDLVVPPGCEAVVGRDHPLHLGPGKHTATLYRDRSFASEPGTRHQGPGS
jgi:alpha-L-rhamnosidase